MPTMSFDEWYGAVEANVVTAGSDEFPNARLLYQMRMAHLAGPSSRFNLHETTCPACFEHRQDMDRNDSVMPEPLDILEPIVQNEEVNETVEERGMTLITEPNAVEEGLGEFQTRNECRCEACKIVNPIFGDRTKLTPARVHNYSYKPLSWKAKSVKDDPDGYFFGVELETDNYIAGGSRDRFGRMTYRQDSMVSNAYAAAMRNPKTLWLPKTDASVTGPEFVSHPATLAYWMKHRSALKKMFSMLLHAGFRSHDNDNAGMHINISRSAFDDADHLYKFITLVHFSPVWARRMAQRTQYSMESWAKVDMGNDKEKRRKLSLWAMNTNGIPPYIRRSGRYDENGVWLHAQTIPNPAYNGRCDRPWVDRYTAINIPEGESRMEFRLPRGTLRVDRFMKNLQWTHGMIEYTRKCGVIEARPAAFMDWAMDNRRKYPDLAAFLLERAPRLRAATR